MGLAASERRPTVLQSDPEDSEHFTPHSMNLEGFGAGFHACVNPSPHTLGGVAQQMGKTNTTSQLTIEREDLRNHPIARASYPRILWKQQDREESLQHTVSLVSRMKPLSRGFITHCGLQKMHPSRFVKASGDAIIRYH